jgi:hypothetical protein
MPNEEERASARERFRKWYWEHREEALEKNRKRYHDLKEGGYCPQCGKRCDRKGVLCKECAKKKLVTTSEYKRRKK